MDARTTMIIAKGKPVSSDVVRCDFNSTSGKWDITFKNGKTFHYDAKNVTFLKNPISLNSKSYQVRHNSKTFDNMMAIYVFRGNGAEYWHICMDEASQTDVATGMLTLSCASNAVIVGDTKQLPNVVTAQQKEQLGAIFAKHQIAKEYNFAQYSFLSSICAIRNGS